MKKKNKVKKKELRKKLARIKQIHLDGLSEKKNKKLLKYMERILDNVLDYYVSVVDKKKNKNLSLNKGANKIKTEVKRQQKNGELDHIPVPGINHQSQ